MKIKCGKYEYDIQPSDTIMDNGTCIQVINRVSLNCSTLKISKKLFSDLLKTGAVEFVKQGDTKFDKWCKYYKIKEAKHVS